MEVLISCAFKLAARSDRGLTAATISVRQMAIM